MKRAALFCIMVAVALSQGTPGAINGTITDPDGGVFPVVFVQLKNTQTSVVSNGTVSAGGRYSITPVAAGSYELSVNVPGMKSYQKTGIAVQTGQTLEINVRLEDGPSLRTLGEDPAGIAAAFFDRPPPPDGPTPRNPDGKPDFSGMWLGGPATPELDMLPWAEALAKARADNNGADFPPSRCLPTGPVPLLGPGFFELIQSSKRLMMMFDSETPGYREVFLDERPHPRDLGPTWLGHSTGKWDGETLVIDSVGFRDKGWLDFEGHPHTEALHVSQRFRRPNLGILEIQITVDDPGAFRKPWTVNKTATLAPNDQIQEYICSENNRDVAHLVGK